MNDDQHDFDPETDGFAYPFPLPMGRPTPPRPMGCTCIERAGHLGSIHVDICDVCLNHLLGG